MADTASLLYGAAVAPEQATEPAPFDSRSLGEALFDSVNPLATQSVAEAVERGAVLPTDAPSVARSLDRELRALGLDQPDGATLLRTIGQAAPEGADEQRAVGATNLALHAAFGADGQRLMAEADRWLATVAPGIHGSLAGSRAATDPSTIVGLIHAYRRSKRR